MAFPKEERNREFLQSWRAGANNGALAERFKLTIGGVKALKQRLRQKHPSLYKKIPVSKDEKVTSMSTVTSRAPGRVKTERKEEVTSTQTSTSTTKRMAFWLEEGMIEEIKELAAKEKRTSSAILREVLGKYLQNK